MKKKKIAMFISGISLLLITVTVFIGIFGNDCKEILLDDDYNELFTKDELKAKGHKSVIPEYSTDVTTGYTNEDGSKTLYVYAAPIRYINSNGQLSTIDTRLANVKDETIKNSGYPYTIANSDIKPFFPAQLSKEKGIKLSKEIEYEIAPDIERAVNSKVVTTGNFIDEQKMQVVYKNTLGPGTQMRFYPSYLGANCEITFDKEPQLTEFPLLLKIRDTDVKVKKEPGGYLILTQDKTDASGKTTTEIVGVVQKPLLKAKNGNISCNCSLEFSQIDKQTYRIQVILDKENLTKASTVFVSFEMRREKQPDNALYSKLPDLEYAYLSNYSVIGNSEDYGIGRLMVRYVFTKNFNLQASQIKEVNYYIYNLNNLKERFEMLSVLEDWCSLTGNWDNHYKTGDQTALLFQERQELKFNITEEVKKWCNDTDGQMEHNGVQIKTVEEREGEYNVLLSNDNSLYRNRTEVILKE